MGKFFHIIFNKDLLKNFFGLQIIIDRRINKISQDPEKKEKSVWFGVGSIIFLICSLILVLCSTGISTLCFKLAFTNLGIFTYIIFIGNIFLLVLGIVVFALPLMFAVYSLMFATAQRRVNKRAIGLVMLIISIIGIFASVGLTILCIVTGFSLIPVSL